MNDRVAATTLYGIANCDSVRRARLWLSTAGVDHHFHDYKRAGVDPDRLRAWVTRLGWEALLNRQGTTFRKMPEVERSDLNAARAITLMLAFPSAIRRPVIESGDALLVGFTPERYLAALTLQENRRCRPHAGTTG